MRKLFFLKKDSPSQTRSGLSINNKQIKLIVGLGNPGDKYKDTMHNIGFLFLDYIGQNLLGDSSELNLEWKSEKLFHYTNLENILLAKPNTFMNDSGKAIKEMLKKFHLSPEEILIVHDDSDIPIGESKLAFNKGAAGHRGILSINNHLKTNAYSRLRIGIRTQSGKAGDFVLRKLTPKEKEVTATLFRELQARYFEA